MARFADIEGAIGWTPGVGDLVEYTDAHENTRRARIVEVTPTRTYVDLLDSPRGRAWFERHELHRLRLVTLAPSGESGGRK